MTAAAPLLLPVDDESGVRRCFAVMHQLRPHLASADELVERWRRQQADGYRLVALFDGEGGPALALAGYRVQENLVSGRFLYVDDLVTDKALRSSGHGAVLISWLKQESLRLQCSKLVLDTPMSNSLGHRFYFRQGLLAAALRFYVPTVA